MEAYYCLITVLVIHGCLIHGLSSEEYILQVKPNCGKDLKTDNPVITVLADRKIYATAKCLNGDQQFSSQDGVHYQIKGTFNAGNKNCRFKNIPGGSTYTVDILVQFGSVGSRINDHQIYTVTCTFDDHGVDRSPTHQITQGRMAPNLILFNSGSVVASSAFKIKLQTVAGRDIVGPIDLNHKVTLLATSSGINGEVGLRPVSCDAVGQRTNSRYSVLRAGCGDGAVFEKSAGFITKERTSRSPYFKTFHLHGDSQISFECNFTLCFTNCDGDSCAVDCGKPKVILNAGRTYTSTNYQSVAKYQCNSGYIQSGPGLSSCGADAVWTVPVISCKIVNCRSPTFAIAGATVSFRTTTFGSTATYSCVKGLNGVGFGNTTCTANGKWSQPTLTCSTTVQNCGRPTVVISNSQVSFNSTTYRSTAVYTCKSGYYGTGTGIISCGSNGKWSPPSLTCRFVNCGRIPVVGNSKPTYTTTAYRSKVVYRCITGFVGSGTTTAVCQSNAKWTSPTLRCTIRNCQRPRFVVPNSSLSIRSTTYGSRATYTCKTGFIQIGPGSTTCGSNGGWSVPRISCTIRNCQRPKFIVRNTYLTLSRTTYGSTATYRCKTGYKQTGSGSIRCLSNGQWSTPAISCRIILCPSLRFLVPNSILNVRSTTYGSKATYRCKTGFIQTGPGLTTCGSNGKWSTPLISCTIRNCQRPKFVVRNSYLTLSRTTYGSAATYKCKTGYKQTGSGLIRCLSNSQWSTPAISCVNIICPSPRFIVPNSILSVRSTTYGSRATYRCKTGFIQTGPGSTTCGINGKWSTPLISCRIRNCQRPKFTVRNSYLTLSRTTYGSTATYRCKTGYKQTGSGLIRCLSNSQWSTPAISCSNIICPRPRFIVPNSILSVRSTIYGSRATYRCKTGFIQTGSGSTTCGINGKWSTPLISCKIKNCQRPKFSVGNSFLTLSRTTYGSTATYRCKTGYKQTGSGLIRCLSNSQWSTPAISCSIRNCQRPRFIVANSILSIRSTTYGSRATYRCKTGFIQTGPGLTTCGSNGKWSTPLILCTIRNCQRPKFTVQKSYLTLSRTTYGSTATYKCKTGYKQAGSGLIRCLSNGQWSKPAIICTMEKCKRPVFVVPNSTFSVDFTHGRAVYRCITGFLQNGAGTASCNATGSWTKPQINCTIKDCGTRTPSITNASPSYKTTTYGSTVRYTCNGGYTQVGIGQSRCASNGKWTTPLITCSIKDCGKPNFKISNARPVVGRSTTYRSNAVYKCIPGYKQLGSGSIVCGADGRWSSPRINCTPLDCSRPKFTIANSEVLVNKTTYGSAAVYRCKTGYYGVGNGTSICNASGKWSLISFKCNVRDCGKIPVVVNSKPTYTTTTYRSTVKYKCSPRYVTSGGITNAVCQANGKWSIPTITCKESVCGLPPAKPNAKLSINSTGINAVALYTCNIGYEFRSGNGTITCLSTKKWTNSSLIICNLKDCKKPNLKIANSHVSYLSTTYGSHAVYQCNTGYKKVGTDASTCGADSRWSKPTITCTVHICYIPNFILPNTDLAVGKTTYGSIATYSCKHGYRSTGSGRIFCGPTGRWSKPTISCTASACGLPAKIQKAAVSVKSVTINGTATYTCDTGYTIKAGSKTITCLSTKRWSTTTFSCKIVDCGKIPVVANSKSTYKSTIYKSIVSYQCQHGYVSTGNGTTVCQANAKWSLQTLTCKASVCGIPPPVRDTDLTVNSVTLKGTGVYRCSIGFKPKSGNGLITCLDTKKWSKSSLVCILSCDGPPLFLIPYSSKTIKGGLATYTCAVGFTRVGDGFTSRCIKSNWTQPAFRCKPVDCGKPEKILHTTSSYLRTTYRYTAKYKCNAGYVQSGIDRISCTSDGKWSPNKLICTIMDCGPPKFVLQNAAAVVNKTVYLSSGNYKCNAGYTQIGKGHITCGGDGKWTKPSLFCKGVNCGKPIAKVGILALKSFNKTHYGARAVYRCPVGYHQVNGTKAEITCLQNGKWAKVTLGCIETVCGKAPVILNALRVVSSNKPNGVATYKCKADFETVGVFTPAKCQLNGAWTKPTGSCKVINCGTAPVIDNAMLSTNSTLYKTVATYKCIHGYDGDGNGTTVCQKNKTWSKPTFVCTMTKCGIPEAHADAILIMNHLKNGTEGRYECKKGYKQIGGTNKISCNRAIWSKAKPICQVIDCGKAPLAPGNSTIAKQASTTTYGATVLFNCKQGFVKTSGVYGSSCQLNGTWAVPTLVCKEDDNYCSLASVPKFVNARPFITTRKLGDKVTYVCEIGHNMAGKGVSECAVSRNWTDPKTKCIPVDCGKPYVPPGAKVTYNKTVLRSSAKFECGKEYAMRGLNVIICSANGKWTRGPICVKKVIGCGHPPSYPLKRPFRPRSTTEGSRVFYRCVPGYRPSGSAISVCRSGRWTKPPVICTVLG